MEIIVIRKGLAICLSLSLMGCVTVRTCNQRQLESMKAQSHSDGIYYASKIDETNVNWMYEYCRLAVFEENRIAKLTKSKTIRIPKFCVEQGLDKSN